MISEQQIQHLIDTKTKPLGALGQLEELAKQICTIQKTLQPKLSNPHVLVFAGDHGMTGEGISAYPKEVTAQMVLNFVGGGAAINVFSRQHDINLKVVDAGVAHDFDKNLNIEHRKVAKGTLNALNEPAMNQAQLEECFRHAAQLVAKAQQAGCNIIGFGEMGIGNTSSAALIQHLLVNHPLEQCVGPGTGLSGTALDHKLQVLEKIADRYQDLSEPEAILGAVGGFEIAMMTQAMISASEYGMIVLVDGFIASAAALCACELKPVTRANLIFCHCSEEPGHRAMLSHLKASPILDLGMRLGEGSGCALAYPLIQSAVNFVNEMASFESASVSGRSND